eukprot:gene36858-48073_t
MSVVLDILQSSPVDSDSFQKSLTLLMVSAREISAARALVSAEAVGTISAIMDSGGVDGIKAAIILSFLLGKDESGGAQLSLLESKPHLGDLLDTIFSNTMNGLDGDGYEFGNFDLIVIVAAIASMAVSEKNKAILVQKPTILRGLFQVLSLFLDDAPPIPYRGRTTLSRGGVGGGGHDTESAESAIEALQLLSFFFESDSDLGQQYLVTIDSNGLSIFQRLLNHARLSEGAKRGAQYLINRLEVTVPTQSPIDNFSATMALSCSEKKHLMLSYAGACRKELVISLQEQLISFGLDVWRDDTGSSLLTKMQGATDDIMAQAIELSHTVVICVSPYYKASANCRQEGKYINVLYKKGKLNIIYVMMDDDYCNSVDGWLALMLGDSLWYPLWDINHVTKTASDIANAIAASGGSGATTFAHSIVNIAPPVPASERILVPVSAPHAKSQTILVSSSAASAFVYMVDVQPEQLQTILYNLQIPQLIPIFESNHVDGALLNMVGSLEDILSIDSSLPMKKIYAMKFFNFVKAWKDDGGRIPRSLLITSPTQSAIHIVDTSPRDQYIGDMDDAVVLLKTKSLRVLFKHGTASSDFRGLTSSISSTPP